MTVGLFPGQGVAVDAVRASLQPRSDLLDLADDVLGYDLNEVVESHATDGKALPTSIAQPAIFTASLQGWADAAERVSIDFVAGHSLGEYPALVAAEAMTAGAALAAVKVRAEATDETARQSGGGMAAVLKLDLQQVNDLSERAGAVVANDNAPGQAVLAGSDEALAEARLAVEEAKGRWVPLDVSGPFHSPMMAPAAPAVEGVLQRTEIRSPRIPVVSNVTGRPYSDPDEIRALLVDQLTTRVRFRESLQWLWDQGVRDFADMGPGEVAAGLARRTFSQLDKLDDSEVIAR